MIEHGSNLTLSKEMRKFENTDKSPRFVQGYYPTHTDFRTSIKAYASKNGYDVDDALGEYKRIGLQSILTHSTYQRFYTGMLNNYSSTIRSNAREFCMFTRSPLAYGFLKNPNRVMSFMSQWVASIENDVVSTDQPTPIRRYRINRSYTVLPLHAQSREQRNKNRHFGKIPNTLIERNLSRLFGADEWLVALSEKYPSKMGDILPVAAYVAGGGFSRSALELAVPILSDYLSAAYIQSAVKYGYQTGKELSMAVETMKINNITSDEGYGYALDVFGDIGGESTLAWALTAERYKLSIAETRAYIETGADPTAITAFIDRGMSFHKAWDYVVNDVDPALFDIMQGDDAL